jgi:hypothetical protein
MITSPSLQTISVDHRMFGIDNQTLFYKIPPSSQHCVTSSSLLENHSSSGIVTADEVDGQAGQLYAVLSVVEACLYLGEYGTIGGLGLLKKVAKLFSGGQKCASHGGSTVMLMFVPKMPKWLGVIALSVHERKVD